MLITSADNLRMDALLDCLVLFTKLFHKPFADQSGGGGESARQELRHAQLQAQAGGAQVQGLQGHRAVL